MKNNMKNNIIMKDTYLIFTITFVIFFIFSVFKNTNVFYYDSGLYWSLANGMVVDGKIDFLKFPHIYRGYFYPFILSIFLIIGKFLGNINIGLVIFNSLISSLGILGMYLLLKKENIVNQKKVVIGSIVASLLLIYFFQDLLLYPLSDIPAFTMFMYSMYLLKKCFKDNDLFNIFKIILSGILIYGAYNTRTIYLYASIILIICFFIMTKFRLKKSWNRIGVLFVAFLIGLTIVAIPQALINKIHNNIYSPKVMTESYSDANQNLFLMQLNWGIVNDKYETYVGDDGHYSSPGIQFKDSTGEKIIELEGGYPESISEWFKLLIKYPLDFMGIYTRHLITYITPIYSESYITNLNNNKSIIILMNMILFIIAGFSVFVNSKAKAMDKNYDKKKSLYDNIWLWISLIPCLLIIPGAPELRFFISLHIMIYVYVCFFVDFKKCLDTFKSNLIFYSFIFLIIIMVWTAIIGGILGHLADANYIFTIK